MRTFRGLLIDIDHIDAKYCTEPTYHLPEKPNPSIITLLKLKVEKPLKTGVNLNTVFRSLNVHLTLITRSRFKQSKIPPLISQSYVVEYFVNFLVIFGYIWKENFCQRINSMEGNRKY